jgi:hypothetical protein
MQLKQKPDNTMIDQGDQSALKVIRHECTSLLTRLSLSLSLTRKLFWPEIPLTRRLFVCLLTGGNDETFVSWQTRTEPELHSNDNVQQYQASSLASIPTLSLSWEVVRVKGQLLFIQTAHKQLTLPATFKFDIDKEESERKTFVNCRFLTATLNSLFLSLSLFQSEVLNKTGKENPSQFRFLK